MSNSTAPQIDDDTAHTVVAIALDMCDVIRRDYPWAQSADSSKRHESVLRDVRDNCLPRFSPVMRATVRALLAQARTDGRAVFA